MFSADGLLAKNTERRQNHGEQQVCAHDPAIHFLRQGHLLCLVLKYFIEWLRNLKDKIGQKNISEGLANVSQMLKRQYKFYHCIIQIRQNSS